MISLFRNYKNRDFDDFALYYPLLIVEIGEIAKISILAPWFYYHIW